MSRRLSGHGLRRSAERRELSLLEPVANRHRAIPSDDVEQWRTGAVGEREVILRGPEILVEILRERRIRRAHEIRMEAQRELDARRRGARRACVRMVSTAKPRPSTAIARGNAVR